MKRLFSMVCMSLCLLIIATGMALAQRSPVDFYDPHTNTLLVVDDHQKKVIALVNNNGVVTEQEYFSLPNLALYKIQAVPGDARHTVVLVDTTRIILISDPQETGHVEKRNNGQYIAQEFYNFLFAGTVIPVFNPSKNQKRLYLGSLGPSLVEYDLKSKVLSMPDKRNMPAVGIGCLGYGFDTSGNLLVFDPLDHSLWQVFKSTDPGKDWDWVHAHKVINGTFDLLAVAITTDADNNFFILSASAEYMGNILPGQVGKYRFKDGKLLAAGVYNGSSMGAVTFDTVNQMVARNGKLFVIAKDDVLGDKILVFTYHDDVLEAPEVYYQSNHGRFMSMTFVVP